LRAGSPYAIFIHGKGLSPNTPGSTCRRFNTHPKDHHHGDEEEEEEGEGREEVLIGLDAGLV
jgi:hypothetical protein